MFKKYYLGLDMGTSTVGWAVTDPDYKLIRKSGKDMWGVREFEEGKTAAERRLNRIARRRRQRETARIGLLKEYFHDAIAAVDPLFYQRLDNSRYWPEDKDAVLGSKYSLFHDKDYTDTDYYREYPTIFHLRMELIKNSKPHDVRLVYLALLNMFKHRGHFLLNGNLSEDSETDMGTLCGACLERFEEINISLVGVSCDEIENILSLRDLSRSGKAEKLMDLLNISNKQKREVFWIKAICGLKVDATKLFDSNNTEEKLDFCFADAGFEEKIPEITEGIGEENAQILFLMKAIYDRGILARLLKGSNYLSEARIKDYEKHKSDLSLLKHLVRKYCTEDVYNKMFRAPEAGSYSAYVNSTLAGDEKKRRNMGGRSREDFYKTVKNCFKDIKTPDDDLQRVLRDIDNEDFMPKQLTASNGVIPNQLHQKEMERILDNARKYLPFLNQKDESGLCVYERILRLFTFQIPYYVGPVTENSGKNGGTGWVVRKEKGQVLPWNFQEKIDIPATSEQFIQRMVRNCTYMSGEKVLPKSSLLYESYCVLNEINNIRINGERITVELKQDLYNDLFKKGRKVTKKQLVKYLINQGVLKEEAELSGIDVTVNNSLGSYGKFAAVFGPEIETDSGKTMIENIIYWGTVFGQDKNLWKQKIQQNYPEITRTALKRILGYKFSDWGRMSRTFLEMEGCDKNTGEIRSLIRSMWETNHNLMELLDRNSFTYREELEKQQKKQFSSLSDITPEVLDDYYFSAPVKKMIWQTFGVIREVEKVMGCPPEKIFVEMTRTDEEKGDKGRKDSRKKVLLEKFRGIKEASRDWKDFIEKEDQSGRLRSKKMFLYISQLGKDMYSGEAIDLDRLFDDNLYDIDHIYPRHFVKDDSIHNNLVLVKKQTNAHKSDTYPLENSIRSNPAVASLWHLLREKGLITEEKYRRLTGRNPFSEEQQADFIARQMVETGQATKGVSELLKEAVPEASIVYSKAGNVSDFRRTYDLLKSRSVNDFHHAHDAYLNIVVGNAYYVKFTQNPLNYIRKEYRTGTKNGEYNLSKMFERNIVRNGETAWIASEKKDPGTIATVKSMLKRNTPILTRQSFIAHGALKDATVYGKDIAKAKVYLPTKTSDQRLQDVTKYGGLNKASVAYFTLVEHTVKGKKVRTLEAIPVYLKEKIEMHPEELDRYLTDYLELKDVSVRMRVVRIQSLIRVNGYFAHISGKTGRQIILRNTVNLCLAQQWINYIKKIENMCERGIADPVLSTQKNLELYEILVNKHEEGIYSKRPNPVGKKLAEGRKVFSNMPVSNQCNLLLQLLNLTKIGGTVADLSAIGGAAKSGIMLISKEITKAREFLLINQSFTGLYENRIDLLKI